MDVKYLKSDWDKMKDGIGELIGKGVWGKGAIDDLKDATKNLEDAEADIKDLDSDHAISFSHVDHEGKYNKLFEQFEVLFDFTGKVGDIVKDTIDEPFHKDIDGFVEAIRDERIEGYTTDNLLGTTKVETLVHGMYDVEQKTVKKDSVSLDDLLAGENFYGNQIKTEFEALQAKGHQDFTEAEYRQAAMNTRAFEYDSIKDQQLQKEFWVDIAALVVVVGATLICPPAGLALGGIYGASQLGSAIAGKDLVSGRELDTQERWVRGALAPLDIIPGAKGVKSFGKALSAGDKLIDVSHIRNLSSKAKQHLDTGIRQTETLVKEAASQSAARMRDAKHAFEDGTRVLKEKAAHGAVAASKVIDQGITNIRNLSPNLMPSTPEGVVLKETVENERIVENKVQDILSKFDVNLGNKGTGNYSKALDDIVKDGSHFLDEFKLKPNVKYETNGYLYQTDEMGRIERASGELTLEMGERNSKHQLAAGGEDRVKAPSTQGDHGGHLIGTQFNGSPLIDNIVAMNGNVNVSAYKKLESAWAKALRDKREVIVDIRPVYEGNSVRPVSFKIKYTVDGEKFKASLKNVYGGK
ncbi:DNA/RNA non-specific endonuclease [Aciduricibacillus chroicocephali]|uniref:DNA/RNA non-specific endonuclease n=1 Tax=Aciduricibacillus chroicocephali TaxID=3054939 RepID=A0ABY9KX74_9BACI|nr:DNA/RNA non-specific endonuclease [Bacillaceae bacterium 44XB]